MGPENSTYSKVDRMEGDGLIREKIHSFISGNIRQNGMVIALVVITLFFGIATDFVIFRPMNISNILMQNSYLIFIAIGMFFCLNTGGNVDLSVGSIVAVTGALVGWLTVSNGVSTLNSVLAAVLFGVLIGVFQAVFIAYLNVPPFIVTLAGMLIFRGLTYVILEGQTLSPFSKEFQYFASGFVFSDLKVGKVNLMSLILLGMAAVALVLIELKRRKTNIEYGMEVTPIFISVLKLSAIIGFIAAILLSLSAYKGVPFIFVVLIGVTILYTFVAEKTVLGRHVYAIGGNINAAALSGVKTKFVMFLVYVNSAFLAAISGIVVAGRLNAATAKAGTGFELDAIAACLIGGASASGGVGSVISAIIGALVMAILNNGMSIMGIGIDVQQVIKGLILLLAVTFDIFSKSRSGK